MDFIVKIYEALSKTMKCPTNYGWYHLLCIAIIIVVTILLVKFEKNHHNEKTLRTVLLVAGFGMILFELYKQFNFDFYVSEGKLLFDFQWYAFPFQFCSTPMYIMIIAGFSKPGKFRDALIAFLATFGLFGGICVYLYPDTVFTTTIGINIQTMFHHGLQIVVGTFVACYYRKQYSIKFYLRGLYVFLILFGIALALDFIVPTFIDEEFNMFFISYIYGTHIPVFCDIFGKVPYPIFLLIYVLAFSFAGLLTYGASKGIFKLNIKRKSKTILVESKS